MFYSDNKLFQGYYIFAKFKQYKITNFNGIKLIAQKYTYIYVCICIYTLLQRLQKSIEI